MKVGFIFLALLCICHASRLKAGKARMQQRIYQANFSEIVTVDLMRAFSSVQKDIVSKIRIQSIDQSNEKINVFHVIYVLRVNDIRYTPSKLKDMYLEALESGFVLSVNASNLIPAYPETRYHGEFGDDYLTTFEADKMNNFWYAEDVCHSIGARVIPLGKVMKYYRWIEVGMWLSPMSYLWATSDDYEYPLDKNTTRCKHYRRIRKGKYETACDNSDYQILCVKKKVECFPEIAKICGSNSYCLNTVEGYACKCFPGFDSDVNGNCVDINECDVGKHGCHKLATCHNAIGGYECQCVDGFSGDGFNCSKFMAFKQRFSVKSINITEEEIDFQRWITIILKNITLESFKTEVVKGVEITELKKENNESYSAVFNVSVVDEMNLAKLLNLYEVQSNMSQSWVKMEHPVPAQTTCLQTKLDSVRNKNTTLIFGETEVDQTVFSINKCPYTGLPLASMKCILGDSFPVFNIKTLLEIPCRRAEWYTEGSERMTAEQHIELEVFTKDLKKITEAFNRSNLKITQTTQLDGLARVMDRILKQYKDKSVHSSAEIDCDALQIIETLKNWSTNVILESGEMSIQMEHFEIYIKNITSIDRDLVKSSKFGTVSLTPSRVTGVEFLNGKAIFIIMHTGNFCLHNKTKYKPKQILSVSLTSSTYEPSSNKAKLEYELLTNENGREEQHYNDIDRFYRCGYFEKGMGAWEFRGCKTVSETSMTKCICSEKGTGFFAVLEETKTSTRFQMNTFEDIASASAILGCFIAIILVLSSRKFRDDAETHAYVHMLVNLAVNYSALMLGSSSVVNSIVPCLAIVVVLHFTQLCTWGWITTATYVILRQTFSTILKPSKRFIGYSCFAVYSCCVFISVVPLVASFTGFSEYPTEGWVPSKQNELYFTAFVISDTLCWLRGPALYYGMLVPVGVLIAVNIVTSGIILRKNLKSENQSPLIASNVIRIFSIMALIIIHLTTINIMSSLGEMHQVNKVGWIMGIILVFTGPIVAILFALDFYRMRQMKGNNKHGDGNTSNDSM